MIGISEVRTGGSFMKGAETLERRGLRRLGIGTRSEIPTSASIPPLPAAAIHRYSDR